MKLKEMAGKGSRPGERRGGRKAGTPNKTNQSEHYATHAAASAVANALGEVVYVIEAVGLGGVYKIGTTRCFRNRIVTLRHASPLQLRVVSIFQGNKLTERSLHAKYSESRRLYEWFNLSATEVEWLKSLSVVNFEAINARPR